MLIQSPEPRNQWEAASLVLGGGWMGKLGAVQAMKPLSDLGKFDFSRATGNASYIGPDGLLHFAGPNEPRIDFTNPLKPAILITGPYPNNTISSAETTAWTGASINANAAVDPEGNNTADILIEDTSNGVHQARRATSLGGTVDGSSYWVGVFVSVNGRTRFSLRDNNQDSSGETFFDLAAGQVLGGSGIIENFGNGYYRCWINPLKNFSTTSVVLLSLINSGTTTSYVGDGVSGVKIWGWQISPLPLPYVPTISNSVSVSSDYPVNNSIADVLTGSAATIIMEVEHLISSAIDSSYLFCLDNNTVNKRIELVRTANGAVRLFVQNGAIQVDLASLSAFPKNSRIALAFDNNDWVVYLNGTELFNAASGTVPEFTHFRLGHRFDGAASGMLKVSNMNAFNARMTNSELATKTAI